MGLETLGGALQAKTTDKELLLVSATTQTCNAGDPLALLRLPMTIFTDHPLKHRCSFPGFALLRQKLAKSENDPSWMDVHNLTRESL